MKLRLFNPHNQRPMLVRTPLPGFDPEYYLSRYPDIRDAGLDPLYHYLLAGWKEGRDPSAGFSTSGYLDANPDVSAAGVNPLLHFVNTGFAEGRSGHCKDPTTPDARPPTAEASMTDLVDDLGPETLPSGVYPSEGDPSRITARYIRDTPAGERGINLGSGGATIPGWINIDSVYPWHVTILWDLSGGLPFVPNESMNAVYSEHFMEHIPRLGGLNLMKEAYRILRPGGYVRIAMPCLDELISNYGGTPSLGPDTKNEFADLYGDLIQTKGEWLNVAMRAWGHMYIYNYEDIAIVLEQAGFKNVRREKLNQSSVPFLSNRETRPENQSSLIVEATKI
jgi:predicted SAM-dependent methyltransferase